MSLTPKQKYFTEDGGRICCHWFNRAEGSTTAIVYDSISKSQSAKVEKLGSSHVLVKNSMELKYIRESYINTIKHLSLPLKVGDIVRHKSSFSVFNEMTGCSIYLHTKDILKGLRFCGYSRLGYVYIDDHGFDCDREGMKWALSRSIYQLKMCGKY